MVNRANGFRVVLVGFWMCAMLGALGCQDATSPAAGVEAAAVPHPDPDSLCRAAVSLEGNDSLGQGSAARVLKGCLERVNGAWELQEGASSDLEAALDSAVAIYPASVRTQVRARLQAVAKVPSQLELRLDWPRLAVGADGGRGILTRPDGVAAPFEEAGEEIWLATRWDAGRLRQVFQAGDGSREDLFAWSPSADQLVLVSTTQGDGMARPLVVTSRYRRK